jgi:hypothetical protein
MMDALPHLGTNGTNTMHSAARTPVGRISAAIALSLATLWITGCSGKQQEPKTTATASATATTAVQPAAPDAASDEPLPPLAYESVLPESVRAELNKSFGGDLDEMVKRRLVRVGVTYNRRFYEEKERRAASMKLLESTSGKPAQ